VHQEFQELKINHEVFAEKEFPDNFFSVFNFVRVDLEPEFFAKAEKMVITKANLTHNFTSSNMHGSLVSHNAVNSQTLQNPHNHNTYNSTVVQNS